PARGLPQLPDALPEQGPLVALSSLLHYAGDRPALCLACDMPFITPALLERVAKAQPEAVVLAPRESGTRKWKALCARYASRVVLPVLTAALAEGERSFQGLFRRLAVQELLLDPSEHAQLRDWDTPEDMRR